MPTEINILSVTFEDWIRPQEIPRLRGALAEKMGPEHVLFHNHLPDGSLRNRYPLIQYKSLNRKASVLALYEGVEATQAFFEKPNWGVKTHNGRHYQFKIKDLTLKKYDLGVNEEMNQYFYMRSWIPLKSDGLKAYKNTQGLAQRLLFLEKRLTGHILSFARGIGWELTDDEQVKVEIVGWEGMHKVRFKQMRHHAFSFHFRTNITLPPYIGLGKGASHGFGMLTPKPDFYFDLNLDHYHTFRPHGK